MSLLVGENLDFHNDHGAGSDKHASGWQKILSLEKPILVWNAFSCNQTLSVNFGLTGEYGELSFNDFILRETVVSGAPAAGRVAKRSPISIPYIEI